MISEVDYLLLRLPVANLFFFIRSIITMWHLSLIHYWGVNRGRYYLSPPHHLITVFFASSSRSSSTSWDSWVWTPLHLCRIFSCFIWWISFVLWCMIVKSWSCFWILHIKVHFLLFMVGLPSLGWRFDTKAKGSHYLILEANDFDLEVIRWVVTWQDLDNDKSQGGR